MTQLHQSARWYRANGYNVFPCRPRSKEPLIKWGDLINSPLPPERVDEIWGKHPEANIALITGHQTGIIVVDTDSADAEKWFREQFRPPRTPEAQTAHGTHFYFKISRPLSKTDRAKGKNIDVKADGACCTLPPSIHPSGFKYQWKKGLGIHEVPIAPLPEEFIRWLSLAQRSPNADLERLLEEGAAEGERNTGATRLAGYLFSMGFTEEEVENKLLEWNAKNTPPLPDTEIITTLQSVLKREQVSHPEGRERGAIVAPQISTKDLSRTRVERGLLAMMIHCPQWAEEVWDKIKLEDFGDNLRPAAQEIKELLGQGGLNWTVYCQVSQNTTWAKQLLDDFPTGEAKEFFLKQLKRIIVKEKILGHMDSLGERDDPDFELIYELGHHLERDSAVFVWDRVEQDTGEFLSTGIPWLDKRLHMRRSHLVFIGGDASVGKSALVQNMAVGFSYCQRKVLIWTGEMSEAEYQERLEKIHGPILGEQRNRFRFLCNASSTADISLAIQRSSPDVVIVDYLQLLEASGYRKRHEQVSAISRALKRIAKREKVLIIAISSLARRNRDQVKTPPLLRDLKESGDLEYDADSVLLIWRDPFNPGTPHREFIIVKQRNGPTMSWGMLFDWENYTFIERYDNENPPEPEDSYDTFREGGAMSQLSLL